VQSAVGLSAGL